MVRGNELRRLQVVAGPRVTSKHHGAEKQAAKHQVYVDAPMRPQTT